MHEEQAGEQVWSTMEHNANSLPATVKPSLPAPFTGKIDGVSLSSFAHKFDTYFRIVELNDNIKMG